MGRDVFIPAQDEALVFCAWYAYTFCGGTASAGADSARIPLIFRIQNSTIAKDILIR